MSFGRPLEEIADARPEPIGAFRAAARPVVLRGLVRDWPAVRAPDIAPYLAALDSGRPAPVMAGPPEIEGRPFYDDALAGFNFERRQATVRQVLDQIAALPAERPSMIYMGSAPAREVAPGFAAANPSPGLPAEAEPRLWIGGATTIQTHYDVSDNVACVVAGRRTFTLFPPEQVANLYVGPLDFTPAGQPISLVQFDRGVDEARFPRFAAAREAALTATLEPGDALYIPPLWWHHVRSWDRLNVLVNYWWSEEDPQAVSPFDCLVHGLAALRPLPPERRAAWRAFFDYYVFDADETTHAHIPPTRRSVLGELTPSLAMRIRQFVTHGLTRR